MMSCKEVSRLVSESLDRKLSIWQRMQVMVHLMMCGMCARFRKQTLFLHAAAKRYFGIMDEGAGVLNDQLTTEAHERIKQSLKLNGQ